MGAAGGGILAAERGGNALIRRLPSWSGGRRIGAGGPGAHKHLGRHQLHRRVAQDPADDGCHPLGATSTTLRPCPGSESIRSFCNRYRLVESSLAAASIDVSAMYDSEARGARLLERMRPTVEQQRLILVRSGQSLHFDAIRDSAQTQFPEHRPTPPVIFSREFERQPAGEGGRREGKEHFKGSDKTDVQSLEEKGRTAKAGLQQQGICCRDSGGAAGSPTMRRARKTKSSFRTNLAKMTSKTQSRRIAECLTVTAMRLQGVTFGRKFSNKPRSFEDRKRNSHCAVCGERGHWKGDPECPQSSKSIPPGSSSRSSSSAKPATTSSSSGFSNKKNDGKKGG